MYCKIPEVLGNITPDPTHLDPKTVVPSREKKNNVCYVGGNGKLGQKFYDTPVRFVIGRDNENAGKSGNMVNWNTGYYYFSRFGNF